MHKLYLRIRFWFLDTFGVRDSEKFYEGHGNFSEVNGWTFRGRFYPCYPGDY